MLWLLSEKLDIAKDTETLRKYRKPANYLTEKRETKIEMDKGIFFLFIKDSTSAH